MVRRFLKIQDFLISTSVRHYHEISTRLPPGEFIYGFFRLQVMSLGVFFCHPYWEYVGNISKFRLFFISGSVSKYQERSIRLPPGGVHKIQNSYPKSPLKGDFF